MVSIMDDECRWRCCSVSGGFNISASAKVRASRPWMGWKRGTADLEKPSTAIRRKRRHLRKISACERQSVNGVQVAIWHEGEHQVLCKEFSCRDVARSIRVYVGSLLEQINGDALAVDDEDSLPKGAYIHHLA